MIKALLKAAIVAAASKTVYDLYKSGKLDGPIGLIGQIGDRIGPRLGFGRPPALDSAYEGTNASRPAPAHPWPVDKKALGKDKTLASAA